MDKCMRSRMMIPFDTITEILYRLPTKSLCRFRCVSKVWLSLITDPGFIKTHRLTLNRNHHIFCNNDRIFTHATVLYSHPFHHHHPHPWMLETTKLPSIESTRDGSSFLIFQGSCDGLVLVLVAKRDLVVFNPATRESMQLPQAPGHYPHHLRMRNQESVHSNSTHGIGYDSVTDDYKVITLTSFQYTTDPFGFHYGHRHTWVTSNTTLVSIYSFRSNTWREVFIEPSPYEFDLPYDSFHAVYFNGFFHWFGTKKDRNRSKVLVAFSLVDECLHETPSPNFCNDTKIMSKDHRKLIVLGGKLAIYVLPEDDNRRPVKFEAWLMNEYGVKESWTRIPLDIIDDGDFCMPKMIFDDNGKIRVATESNMLIYDFEKRTFSKNVHILSRRFSLFGSYVESLVSPKRKDTTDGSRSYVESLVSLKRKDKTNEEEILDRSIKKSKMTLLLTTIPVLILSLVILVVGSVIDFGSIVIYFCTFVMGFGPIPNILCAEIFPTRVRGLCIAICALTFWICDIIGTYSLPVLLTSVGLSGVFGVYADVCVIAWVFVFLKVPETKGMPLEVITEFFAVGAKQAAAAKNH